MSQTRTGNFPIGVRIGWSDWQKDPANVARWAKQAGLSHVDYGAIDADKLKAYLALGVGVGSIDLKAWGELGSKDAGKRKAAAQLNIDYVKSIAALGCNAFFMCLMPEDPAAARKDNFAYYVDSLGQLTAGIESTGARIVIEGWPGGAPHYANLACNTSDTRALFKAVPSKAIGINYDPSHLIRMGIDHIKFLDEFVTRVGHVHGKDTALLPESLHEHGNLQNATFDPAPGFGGTSWRYCIPGHGVARWAKILCALNTAGFKGKISIELEDCNFNGTEAGEKLGITNGAKVLETF
jgi:sugar phosphate isomerase/epimerase